MSLSRQEQAATLAGLVDVDDAGRVLWHYLGAASGAPEPGGFFKALTEAVVRADQLNRRKLAASFPGLVAAVQLADAFVDGFDHLRLVLASGRRGPRL